VGHLDNKVVVTIGVCVRNCESSIMNLIETIVRQDYPHELMEVVFIDDGSKDQTLSFIKNKISEMSIKAKVYHQEWMGLGPARNMVVKSASGSYIVWVDCNTFLPRDYVRKLENFMEHNPLAGIAAGRYLIINSGENLITTLEDITLRVVEREYKEKTSKLPGTCGSIYRVRAIRDVGGFDDTIRGAGEDIDAGYKIRKSGWNIYFTIDASFHSVGPGSWRTLWKKNSWYGYGMHYVNNKHKGIIDGNFNRIPFLQKMLPISGFLQGILFSISAYRIIKNKIVFLLPMELMFKRIAWCIGYYKGHLDGYGH
jgi:cellulose synthase/poly-beta-1,6-N-acetylglucosamine synthase-like glycosyltransferase